MANTEKMLEEIHSVLFPKKKDQQTKDQETADWFETHLNRKKFKRLNKSK